MESDAQERATRGGNEAPGSDVSRGPRKHRCGGPRGYTEGAPVYEEAGYPAALHRTLLWGNNQHPPVAGLLSSGSSFPSQDVNATCLQIRSKEMRPHENPGAGQGLCKSVSGFSKLEEG